MVMIQLRQIDVPPGQRLLFHDVSWAAFEAILEELVDQLGTWMTYDVEQIRVEERNKAMRAFQKWVTELSR